MLDEMQRGIIICSLELKNTQIIEMSVGYSYSYDFENHTLQKNDRVKPIYSIFAKRKIKNEKN